MATSVPDLAQIRVGLDELVTPLRAQLTALDAAIEQQTAALAELRSTRSAITRTIAMLDPSSVEKKASTNGGESPKKGVSPQMRQRIREWLEQHKDAPQIRDGFHASGLSREPTLNISQAQLSAGLPMLRDEGFVRLDRQGSGGAKIYKLVS